MSKGDEEGGGHDADDGENESGAEGIEWARNPVDKNEVDGEGDEDGGGGEFMMREDTEMSETGED